MEVKLTCDDYVWGTETGKCLGRVSHCGGDASCADCPSRKTHTDQETTNE